LKIYTYFLKIARMKTKLTLSIEKNTLLKAKKLSARKKKSISRLFEEYVEKNQTSKATPISDSLRGILKKAASDKSYDELRAEAINNKYDL
jgi:regulator of replication initiation timing